MDNPLTEFLTETAESMDTLDVELVRLEQNPSDPEILNNIFRLVHTVKSTCGILGLPRLEAVAHASENVLGKVRDGVLDVTPAGISLILQSLDRIKEISALLEQTEQEPEGDDAELIGQLNALAEDNSKPAGPDDETPDTAADEAAPADAAPPNQDEGFPVAAELVEEVAEPTGTASAEAPVTVEAMTAEDGARAGETSLAAESIRVHVEVLEDLMTMVSELVLTRNQLLQIQRAQDSDLFAAPLQSLNFIVSELQEGVMKTRMQPIGNAWSKLSRIVRDLAQELGKKIELRMHGQETELDRQVLELIRDPLTHMVRNSADHGLETPKERLAAGKPETGVVHLNAFHQGGHIIIEIKDDGRGLNVDKIKSKAIANGLASEAELAGMPDAKIHQFILKPGFSTAEKVTNVSGRGVGLDVVRTNIERIGGTVEMVSAEGKGSTFTIKIPLTLAIVAGLIVECAGERFSIPQISVLELVRASADSEHRIEQLNDTPVLRLRDKLLPLVSLRSLLQLEAPVAASPETLLLPAPEAANDATPEPPAVVEDGAPEDAFIVVTQVGAHIFGIIVDRVFDTEEIVVKPVAPILRDIQLYSGNTILGDGGVIMILDPNGIAAASGEVSISSSVDEEAMAEAKVYSAEKVTMLVFRAGSEAPKSVPLALIARLEEFDVASIERSNDQMLTQYRGRLVPLIPFDPAQQLRESGRQPVLVFSEHNHTMGLIVDEIIDIVDVELSIELASERTGILGSAIISGTATEVIDAGLYLTRAFPDWFTRHAEDTGTTGNNMRVLLVDDSPFFRNMLMPLLEISGYQVTAAESAHRALDLCEQGHDFDIIVSDIEMPGMNGFDFAMTVKDGTRWQQIPMLALSSHTSQKDLERGRQVGFADYVAKFDRSALLQTLTDTLAVTRSAA